MVNLMDTARMAYEAARVVAAFLGESDMPPWEKAAPAMREAYIDTVRQVLTDPDRELETKDGKDGELQRDLFRAIVLASR